MLNSNCFVLQTFYMITDAKKNASLSCRRILNTSYRIYVSMKLLSFEDSIYRDNSRILGLCADGAQSKFLCAIFEGCAPYVTVYVYNIIPVPGICTKHHIFCQYVSCLSI